MFGQKEREQFIELGMTAAANYAKGINAGNAHEFAAQHICRKIDNGVRAGKMNPRVVIELQTQCRVDLSSLLMLGEEDELTAIGLVGGGAMRWLSENPDE
jgi:hypothetical protein